MLCLAMISRSQCSRSRMTMFSITLRPLRSVSSRSRSLWTHSVKKTTLIRSIFGWTWSRLSHSSQTSHGYGMRSLGSRRTIVRAILSRLASWLGRVEAQESEPGQVASPEWSVWSDLSELAVSGNKPTQDWIEETRLQKMRSLLT